MRITDRYRDWQTEAGWMLKSQHPRRISGNYRLHVEVARPDNRRRDLDNIGFKAVCDLLVKHGVLQDDSLAMEISAKWIKDGDGITVTIST
jgi:Holliday junction resolvase RusA-like endonuclease